MRQQCNSHGAISASTAQRYKEALLRDLRSLSQLAFSPIPPLSRKDYRDDALEPIGNVHGQEEARTRHAPEPTPKTPPDIHAASAEQ